MSASVVLAESAEDALLSLRSRSDAIAVARRLAALQTFPETGTVYEPDYEAARPDHEVIVTYAGHLGIYYVYERAEDGQGNVGTVYVEWIRDERMNPKVPFR